MAADRARLTHDPSKRFREVVAQQGRVTLEADINEATRLSSETARAIALDTIGPAGTSDDGYAVTVDGGMPGVGPGSFWLGGLRLALAAPFHHDAQPDWRDAAADPVFAAQPTSGTPAVASLWVREHEVGATEDASLRETALGGPDSAARTRLVERMLLLKSVGADCGTARAELIEHWRDRGYLLGADGGLAPLGRLRVGLVATAAPPTPCDPPALSGYLGADNQLIRVQIAEYDRATQRGVLVWAFDNASHLHRCTAVSATVLELAARPVSVEAAPSAGGAVELLMATAGDADGDIAALVGHVAALSVPYDPATRRVTMPAAVPAAYRAAGAPPLFLRVWSGRIEFRLGDAVVLPETGLSITLSSISGGAMGVGDHWGIAVRPFTPGMVYPPRLLDAPQPPDGPRQWATALAVLGSGGAGGAWHVTSDCRPVFDDLVTLTARDDADDCHCTIVAGPEDDLRALPWPDERAVMLCLKAGKYAPGDQLVLNGQGGDLLLVGAGPATRLEFAKESGLILENWRSVTISDLSITTAYAGPGPIDGLGLVGGLVTVDCDVVTVERVEVRGPSADHRATACIRIFSLAGPTIDVRIANCRCDVGRNGVGILVTHAERVEITGNVVTARPSKELYAIPRSKRRRMAAQLLGDVAFDDAARDRDKNMPGRYRFVDAGKAAIAFDSPFDSDAAWQQVARKAAGSGDLADGRALRRKLLAALTRYIGDASDAPQQLRKWFEAAHKRRAGIASQGIVVGGTIADEVIVSDNSVTGATQGIHLGLSHQDPSRRDRDVIGRAMVTGNRIVVATDPLLRRERHGVFVGNCDSTIIRDNHIVHPVDKGRDGPIEAVRLFGQLGKFAIIANNHARGFTVGYRVEPLNPPAREGVLWQVNENVAEQAADVVVAPEIVWRSRNFA